VVAADPIVRVGLIMVLGLLILLVGFAARKQLRG
jgi:hypothetical protein